MENNLLNLLGSDAYWVLNKKLVNHLGCDTTLLLQHFIDLQFKLFKGEEFYQQQERITEETSLGEHVIRERVKKLVNLGILTSEKKGSPAKNYYSINQEAVMSILRDESNVHHTNSNRSERPSNGHQVTHSGQENGQLVVRECDNQWSESLTTSGHKIRPQRKELIRKELSKKEFKKPLRKEEENHVSFFNLLNTVEGIQQWGIQHNRKFTNSIEGIIKYENNYLSLSVEEKVDLLMFYSKLI
jgi:DNA-binding Lrp family transcriptional regulator